MLSSASDVAPALPEGGRQLDPRIISKERLVGWATAVCVTAVLMPTALIIWIANRLPATGGIAVMAAALTLSGAAAWALHAWPAASYRHTSYRVDDLALEIRRGVVWRRVITIPRSRVQHTDVSQGPLERSYGLGTLVVYTAGTDHARVALSGLAHATAMALRERLLDGRDGDGV